MKRIISGALPALALTVAAAMPVAVAGPAHADKDQPGGGGICSKWITFTKSSSKVTARYEIKCSRDLAIEMGLTFSNKSKTVIKKKQCVARCVATLSLRNPKGRQTFTGVSEWQLYDPVGVDMGKGVTIRTTKA